MSIYDETKLNMYCDITHYWLGKAGPIKIHNVTCPAKIFVYSMTKYFLFVRKILTINLIHPLNFQ